MMSPEEERDLIIAWRERGDETAFMKLADQQKRLMLSQARRHVNSRADYDDFLQQGTIGLMRAIEKFDLSRDNRLVTYGNWFTLDEISRYGRENSTSVKIPHSHMTGKGKEIWEAWVEDALACSCTGDDGSEAAITERVAAKLSVTEERVASVVDAWRSGDHSMDAPLHAEDGDKEQVLPTALVEGVTGEIGLLRDEAQARTKVLAEGVMSCLDDREKDIIRRRRFEQQTLEQVGIVHSLSRERVRQLEARAIQKMQSASLTMREDVMDCLSELR